MALHASEEDAWLSAMPTLIETHGLEVLSAWRDDRTKHKHKLVHTAAAKCFVEVLKAMAALGFDMNVQRDSDQCTPLHLAIFYKKPQAIAALKELGADASLKNSYGESCDAKYEKLAESMLNIVFLDLELTHGHYDVEPARILEVAVVVTDKDLNELGRGHWVVAGFSADDLNGLPQFHQARAPPSHSAGHPARVQRPAAERLSRTRARPPSSQKTFRDAEPGGGFPPLPDAPGNGLFSDVLGSKTFKEQVAQQAQPATQARAAPRRNLPRSAAASLVCPHARAPRAPRSCSRCCASTASRRRVPLRATRSSATARCSSSRCRRSTTSSTTASSTCRASRASWSAGFPTPSRRGRRTRPTRPTTTIAP